MSNPLVGELDGKIYKGQELRDLMRNGTQDELVDLVVTYDSGNKIRPFRFCPKVAETREDPETGALTVLL